MLDFKELSKDGNDLELLIREILLVKGYRVHWSGKGSDGGKDLIFYEQRDSEFLDDTKTWLVQCKHKAHSGSSVGISELDDITDSCIQHAAQGYLLVCSTYPSSAVVNRLAGMTNNPNSNIGAVYWDASKIEQVLFTPQLWRIAQRFFPISSQQYGLNIYATENPNHWIANFKGYHFHLSNRIGSKVNYHFTSIERRIKDIENIELPQRHFIRIRAIYYDDKHGDYTWFLDYMHPHDEATAISSSEIAYVLRNGYTWDDGQTYFFDVISRSYFEFSDHYDKDHYDYYNPYLQDYLRGYRREIKESNVNASIKHWPESEGKKQTMQTDSFNKLIDSLKSMAFIRLIRSVNSTIEELERFSNQRDWSEIIDELKMEEDRFFSAWFFFETNNEEELLTLISYFPQEFKYNFRFTKPYIYTPKEDGIGSELLKSEDYVPYELTLRVNPYDVTNSYFGRKLLNEYFDQIRSAIERYLTDRSNS